MLARTGIVGSENKRQPFKKEHVTPTGVIPIRSTMLSTVPVLWVKKSVDSFTENSK